MVIYFIDPVKAGAIGLGAFYLSLGVSLTGTFFLLGFLIRYLFNRQAIIARLVSLAFRQAILLAIILIGALLLQSQRLLTWWNVILLVLALAVIEFLAVTRKRRPV